MKSPRDVANPPMDMVRVVPVIQCTVLRRGAGIESDPIRLVTQYFSVQGELLAEFDPSAEREKK